MRSHEYNVNNKEILDILVGLTKEKAVESVKMWPIVL